MKKFALFKREGQRMFGRWTLNGRIFVDVYDDHFTPEELETEAWIEVGRWTEKELCDILETAATSVLVIKAKSETVQPDALETGLSGCSA